MGIGNDDYRQNLLGAHVAMLDKGVIADLAIDTQLGKIGLPTSTT